MIYRTRIIRSFALISIMLCVVSCQRHSVATTRHYTLAQLEVLSHKYFTLEQLGTPHKHFDGWFHTGSTVVLISQFGDTRSIMDREVLYQDGARGGGRFVKNWAIQGAFGDGEHDKKMPHKERARLDTLLSRMPATQPPGKIANTVLVSWDDHGTWVTRTYDRAKLPKEVIKLRQFIVKSPVIKG